jgi:hypothetical protein
MSRRGKAATCRRSPHAFRDTKLGWNWVKLGSFSFFEKVEIGEIVNV